MFFRNEYFTRNLQKVKLKKIYKFLSKFLRMPIYFSK